MNDVKLKPCPFCGGEAKIDWPDHAGGATVECTQCGNRTAAQWEPPIKNGHIEAEADAVAAWNRRAINSHARLIEALEPLEEYAKDRCADAPEWNDDDTVSIPVRIGDLRRAVSALSQAREDTP